MAELINHGPPSSSESEPTVVLTLSNDPNVRAPERRDLRRVGEQLNIVQCPRVGGQSALSSRLTLTNLRTLAEVLKKPKETWHGSKESNTFGKAKNLNPLSNKEWSLRQPG